MAESSTSARVPSLLRACENCRSRKTRCDKRMPCSSCQTLGTTCQPPQSASGYRPRILISSQYENQIHLIQERLSTIEQSVRDGLSAIELRVHRLSLQNHTPATASDLEQNPTQTETPTTHVLSSAIPLVEGDSPFVRQTIHATETAEATLNSLEPGPTGDAVTRLAALKNTLETNCSPQSYDPCLSRCHTQPLNPDGDLPPTCFVVEVVKKIKDHPPITLVGFSWHDMSLIERLCQQVYLPFEQPSVGSTALLHGFMFFILRDLIEEGNPFAKKYDCLSYLEAFKRRFSSALTTYEVVAVPALENIQALLLGAIRALEEGNISLSWTYISSACTMCLTLGFHRRSIVENDHPAVVKEKLHVFWMLYMSDKNLSYTLGRCSNFRDCDIDCDYFPISTNRRLAPWDLANLVCIKLGTLQSKVYDSLYTATARQLVPDTKTQLVEGFAIELQNIRNQARSVGIGESGHRVLLTSFMQINPSEAYFAEQ
ncbi:hypothetical protein B0J12DRAFT_686459 [Macrophomina phaseolina]|uniref:Zn(2)-C6 fungal-type domain-containing protein n=1 Tax=Macrophomina phaseolina TaxID=35725 RepID=A0ABQ8FVU6_9PEZI|nr:hypothetical protein B0J12DRAFT_686459 [Macrophomina phaseolina]